jgi:hypothetical protein
MDVPVQVSTTASGGRSRSATVLAGVGLVGVVLVGGLVAGGIALASADWSATGPATGIDAVVVDQGGPGGGSGVIPAQRGSGRDCPWEGGQAPDATPTQL